MINACFSIPKAPTHPPPLIIAHRGASGYLPEHTLESYRMAIAMGADFIEPDLVATKDGHLIARHEPNLIDSTDVSTRSEFANRKKVMRIDGVEQVGWFASDFTLSEIKQLRARQIFAERDQSHNDQYMIPTFAEVLQLAQSAKPIALQDGSQQAVGVYPETKHPTLHQQLGLPLEERLLAQLRQCGWNHRSAPVFIQSFEVSNLKHIRQISELRLVQLVGCDDLDRTTGEYIWHPENRSPYDVIVQGGSLTYEAMLSPTGLQAIAQYADVVAPWKRLLIGSKATHPKTGEAAPTNSDGWRWISPIYQEFVKSAHAVGLAVHTWTLRSEPHRLLADYANEPEREYWDLWQLGVDGVFTDFTDVAIRARQGGDSCHWFNG